MSNLRPRAASRLSVTLLDPHSAPALGTSLPPSEPPPEGGGLVVAVVLGAGRVVVGAGRVVVVAGLVVVVVAPGDVAGVAAGAEGDHRDAAAGQVPRAAPLEPARLGAPRQVEVVDRQLAAGAPLEGGQRRLLVAARERAGRAHVGAEHRTDPSLGVGGARRGRRERLGGQREHRRQRDDQGDDQVLAATLTAGARAGVARSAVLRGSAMPGGVSQRDLPAYGRTTSHSPTVAVLPCMYRLGGSSRLSVSVWSGSLSIYAS